jgi:fructose-1-phosphate kinase PfkB-like protein
LVWALSEGETPLQAFAKGVACATATLVSTASGLADTELVLKLLEQVQCQDGYADAELPV